ncbi:hypothetical protein IQ37_07505 [Chryseobacterium piperi]|uniref:Uncharacterized protein n=1 Tax=Chryseobacterium piperi TaxID=558152 RepID=A0A086BJQ1_9FLAO|nr:hypothetical protein [Chryseobacterium piperi]ASW74053.1 hypothetical protein CJF12_06930 [Chryseobacterium piperi]KFF29165.1 hypothetical protein IQ37_07505 [Chryseobacterium piperi]
MKRKLFKYKVVYYLAITISLILFLVSTLSLFSVFKDFSIFKFLIAGFSIVVNSFAFVNLVEKYDKAILFLNLSLALFTIFTGYYALILILKNRFHGMMSYPDLKFFLLFVVILFIVNKYKIKGDQDYNEIDNIGQNEE